MDKIKTILFAASLTENSRSYFSVSSSLAAQLKAGIFILHVMEGLQETYEGIAVAIFGEEKWRTILHEHRQNDIQFAFKDNDLEKQIVKAVLGEFCSDADKNSKEFRAVKRDIIVSDGNIVEEILRQAKRNRCDLIVMGTSRGNSSGTSTSPHIQSVIKKTAVPVVLAPLPSHL